MDRSDVVSTRKRGQVLHNPHTQLRDDDGFRPLLFLSICCWRHRPLPSRLHSSLTSLSLNQSFIAEEPIAGFLVHVAPRVCNNRKCVDDRDEKLLLPLSRQPSSDRWDSIRPRTLAGAPKLEGNTSYSILLSNASQTTTRLS